MRPDAIAPIGQADVFALQDYPAPLQRDGVLHEVIASDVIRVPLGAKMVVMRCDRSNFDGSKDIVLKARALISYDGGQKFELLFSFTTSGELVINEDGSPLLETSVKVPLLKLADGTTVCRVEMIPLKPLKTDLRLEFA